MGNLSRPSVPPLISATDLAEALANPTDPLQVIDCRFQLGDPQWGYQQYQQGHIAGAIYLNLDLDLSSPKQAHGGRHPLPEIEALAATFERSGITSGETWVVAYDDSRFAFASRLWWLLRYLGHDRVSVLDGGWPAWQALSGAVSTASPIIPPGRFVPEVRTDWVVNYDTVRSTQHSSSTLLVDSRERDRYEGLREPIDPVAGHIPSAICLPWQEVTNTQGYAQSSEILKNRWEQATSPDGQEMIVYCGSGVTACVNLLSQEIAGLPIAKLYPGGWSDWCSYPLE